MEEKRVCSFCGSENIAIQAVKKKRPFVIGFGLIFLGFCTMWFGIVVGIVAFPIGLLVGVIVKAIAPEQYESVIVCQSCGKNETIQHKKK